MGLAPVVVDAMDEFLVLLAKSGAASSSSSNMSNEHSLSPSGYIYLTVAKSIFRDI